MVQLHRAFYDAQAEKAPYLRCRSLRGLYSMFLTWLQTKVKIRCGLQCKPLDKPNLPKIENIRQAFLFIFEKKHGIGKKFW